MAKIKGVKILDLSGLTVSNRRGKVSVALDSSSIISRLSAISGNFSIGNDTNAVITFLGELIADGTISLNNNTLSFDGSHSYVTVDPRTGANLAGYRLILEGGQGTGTAVGGSIYLRTTLAGGSSNSTANSYTDILGIHGTGNAALRATSKLLFDNAAGGGHTYIQESSDDVLDMYVGGDKMLTLDEAGDRISTAKDVNLTTQNAIIFNTYDNVDKIYSDGDDLIFVKDDSDVLFIKDAELKSDLPVKIKESASAVSDSSSYGQVWVKNDTPNNLYFTNDAGNDVQITNGSSLAGGGGGSAYWTPQWSQRYYTRYDRWFSPSTTYGASYYQWNKDNSNGVLASWLDTYNPVIVVPKNCTLNRYTLQGRPTGSATYEFKLLKASPNWGTNGNHTLSQVGSTQSGSKTASVYEKLEETGLSVSLSAGDILIPMLRRTTTNTSSYYFWYSVFSLEATFG